MLQFVERGKDFRPIIDLGRRTMQLHQVESYRAARFCRLRSTKAGQIFAIVAIGGVRLKTTARFGRDVDLFFGFAQHLGDKSLASAVPVDVSRVDEIDPIFNRGVQYSVPRLRPVHRPRRRQSAKRPRLTSETSKFVFPNFAVVH